MRPLIICLIPLLIAAVGCNGRQVRTAKAYGIIDRAPQLSDKGYVEFYTHKLGAPVPIYQLDAKGRPYELGAVGLRQGDEYSRTRYAMDVSERLRVAVPPGNQTFMFERDGQRVRVPVSAGQVTPVQIHYTRLHKGELFDFYQVDTDLLPSKSLTELPPPTPGK